MLPRLKNRFRVLALVGAVAASLHSLAPASAGNTVTLTIVARGTLNAAVVDGELLPIDDAEEATRVFGSLKLIVRDPRGTSEGWSVSLAASDFVYLGESPTGRDIPSTGFRIRAVNAPEVIVGQPPVAGGPNFDPHVGSSLDTPRTVIWAEPGAGSGDYQQRIDVVLDVPAGSQAGTYRATLTVAFASGP